MGQFRCRRSQYRFHSHQQARHETIALRSLMPTWLDTVQSLQESRRHRRKGKSAKGSWRIYMNRGRKALETTVDLALLLLVLARFNLDRRKASTNSSERRPEFKGTMRLPNAGSLGPPHESDPVRTRPIFHREKSSRTALSTQYQRLQVSAIGRVCIALLTMSQIPRGLKSIEAIWRCPAQVS